VPARRATGFDVVVLLAVGTVDEVVGALDGRINTRASGQVADHDVARRSAAAQDANVQAARNQSRHNEAAQCA